MDWNIKDKVAFLFLKIILVSLFDILGAYNLHGASYRKSVIESGHINDSFLLTSTEEATAKYFLQKINKSVFPSPEQVMKNIEKCLTYQNENQILGSTSLSLLKTHENASFFIDDHGESWRIYSFLEGYTSADKILSPSVAEIMGKTVAHFSLQLSEANPLDFHSIIPNFHNLSSRLLSLQNSLKIDQFDRAKFIKKELQIVDELATDLLAIQNQLENGKIPMRVSHNDTKSSNIMIDNKLQNSCMIDLDTVMPGSLLFDFGDAVRSIISFTKEDEKTDQIPELNWSLFTPFMNRYLEEIEPIITQKERQFLDLSCSLLPFLMGVRFLTDFLDGDGYFKTNSPEHNLDRASNQLMLSKSIFKFVYKGNK